MISPGLRRVGLAIGALIPLLLIGCSRAVPPPSAASITPLPPATSSGSPTQVVTPAPEPPAESPPLPTASAAPKTYPVQVYFSRHPASDDDPSRVFPLLRTAPDLGVGKFAIAALLTGPTGSEAAQGYFTDVRLRAGTSTCGADFTLTVSAGVATLKFCRVFDHVGVMSDGRAEAALNATLKQFPTVSKVVILNSAGNCEFDLSGLNNCKQ